MIQTRKRKKRDTQRVPVVGCHSPVFGITASLMVIAKPFPLHEVSISPLGRFVNPKITFRAFWGTHRSFSVCKYYTNRRVIQ